MTVGDVIGWDEGDERFRTGQPGTASGAVQVVQHRNKRRDAIGEEQAPFCSTRGMSFWDMP